MILILKNNKKIYLPELHKRFTLIDCNTDMISCYECPFKNCPNIFDFNKTTTKEALEICSSQIKEKIKTIYL